MLRLLSRACLGALMLLQCPLYGATNLLLEEWKGQYGGVPPLDKVKVADFKPALEAAMAENLKEVDSIAGLHDQPTFANTIEALESSGATYRRVHAIYDIWSSTMAEKTFQAIESEMDPKIAAFHDQITQNSKLFARVDAVYQASLADSSPLTPEQKRLAWVYYDDFVRSGAKLDKGSKDKVSAINQKLAGLYASFSQNLLADEGTFVVCDEKDLAGLPDWLKSDAAAAATDRGQAGKWVILNTRSSVEPFLTYATNRGLREKVWRAFVNRGDNADAHDNNKTITEILKLRAERAKLLGFATHAHWRVANKMAKTPEAAMKLMMQVWPAAVARVKAEVSDMQAVVDKERGGFKIAPWDYRYYAEKVRKEKFDLDMNEVKPYLQLDKLREAMFWVAGELYGFHFGEVSVPKAVDDMRVWEVTDGKGKHVGLWYFDPYARPTKRSGAWMSEYRTQSRKETPIVSNNTNFVKGKPGEPILISWDDAVTLFHEFGHALHGLNSDVTYASLAGTSVPTDYAEFPSQINENWLPTTEVLTRFAIHHKTGKPLPKELLTKLNNAKLFNQGFDVTEYLSAALVDMKLHLADADKIDPDSFERTALKELGMPDEIVMRHRTPQFAHLFSSDDYSAGYYSYLWSEVLDYDAFHAFVEAAGPFDKAVAKRLRDNVMAVGNAVDPAIGFRKFRGRDPSIEAYLAAKGFGKPSL